MKTGIIILNYNSSSDVHKCVKSIREHTEDEYRIYVVDNNSREEERQNLSRWFLNEKDVTVILLDENLGYSGGNNQGIHQAIKEGMEHILIVNPDVELKNDVIGILGQELSEECPYVGPRVIDLDGKNGQRIRKNISYKRLLFSKKPLYYFRKLFSADLMIQQPVNEPLVFRGSLSGCCFMVDSSLITNCLGELFDDNVFLYYEEYILGKQIEANGYRAKYVPSAVVRHLEGSSTKKISTSFIDYHMYASEYYYLCRFCTKSKLLRWIVGSNRRMIYFLKNLMRYHDWKRFFALKRKMKAINQGDYKITF